MVQLHVKKGEESQFLFEAPIDSTIDSALSEITVIYNGRLKVGRICMDMEELANHGPMLPPNIIGLTDEQVSELKLVDEWADKCVPSGGWTYNQDEIGRRNGRQPNEKMRDVLHKTVEEAKAIVSKKQVQAGIPVTRKMVLEALDLLRGAVTIVYPMGLPPHDDIQKEFDNNEDLTGTQASLEVIETCMASLWFSGKEMNRTKKFSDYMGRNDKTRAVVKLQKVGQGAPSREPVMTEAQQKEWMLHAYRKQEELKVGEVPCSSSLELVDNKCAQTVDSTICNVDLVNAAPKLPIDIEDNEAETEGFIYNMLSRSNNSSSTLETFQGSSSLVNISSSLSQSPFNIFKINK